MIKEYGYEYDAVLYKKLWEDTRGHVITKKMKGAYCLRSGRDALKAIAREYQPCVVLLPALACDSMVFPFEMYGHQIKYYKLKKDYSIDIEDLRGKIGSGINIFLYMDYFGCSAISDNQLEELRKNNIVFIEDRTHNLLEDSENTFLPDYVIASLRKWLAIPDGGLLWGGISKRLENDTSFSETRLKAQLMRHEFLQTGDESIKKEYRKIFSTVADIMDTDDPCAMSAYSYSITMDTDLEKIRLHRKKNAEVLSSILSPYSFGNSCLYVPFMVENRDYIQQKLSSVGIFNTIIWPLREYQREACETARYTEAHMLAAPCDQRYSEADMQYIGKEIMKVIENG